MTPHQITLVQETLETVGAALLWTLERGLGAAFTSEVKDAWAVAYTTLAEAMQVPVGEA
jgi:nitric oxide dioxygenase